MVPFLLIYVLFLYCFLSLAFSKLSVFATLDPSQMNSYIYRKESPYADALVLVHGLKSS